MIGRTAAALAAIALAPATFAAVPNEEAVEKMPDTAAIYERVDSFSALGGLSSFRALDNERLIVWRTPSKPYLIELRYPSLDLRWAHGIAIDSRTSRIYSGFDSVRVRGIKYPIEGIYKLSREQAREL